MFCPVVKVTHVKKLPPLIMGGHALEAHCIFCIYRHGGFLESIDYRALLSELQALNRMQVNILNKLEINTDTKWLRRTVFFSLESRAIDFQGGVKPFPNPPLNYVCERRIQKMPFRIIIAGSRDFNNYELLKNKLDSLLANKNDIEIVSGTCNGADLLGERYGLENNYPINRFPADWDKFGKRAGPLRNEQMADNTDALVAFWDGKSRGTNDMIENAKKRGLLVRVILV